MYVFATAYLLHCRPCCMVFGRSKFCQVVTFCFVAVISLVIKWSEIRSLLFYWILPCMFQLWVLKAPPCVKGSSSCWLTNMATAVLQQDNHFLLVALETKKAVVNFKRAHSDELNSREWWRDPDIPTTSLSPRLTHSLIFLCLPRKLEMTHSSFHDLCEKLDPSAGPILSVPD